MTVQRIETYQARRERCRILLTGWDAGDYSDAEYGALVALGAEPFVLGAAHIEGEIAWHYWAEVSFPEGALYRLTL